MVTTHRLRCVLIVCLGHGRRDWADPMPPARGRGWELGPAPDWPWWGVALPESPDASGGMSQGWEALLKLSGPLVSRPL